MSDPMTDLDKAQAQANSAAPEQADQARLAFFGTLADTPLLVLLEREAVNDVLEPRIFALDEGQVVLAFDTEERLAAMGQGPLPYAELPGRVLARLLVAEGLGLGLNLGSGAASEMLLPLTAMRWLDDMLGGAPDLHAEAFGPLQDPPQNLVQALARILTNAPPTWGGLATAAHAYGRGQGGLVVVSGAHPDAEIALASALSEAFRFADLQAGPIDIAFAGPRALPTGGVTLDWPAQAKAPVAKAPAAPGTVKDKPPKLR